LAEECFAFVDKSTVPQSNDFLANQCK